MKLPTDLVPTISGLPHCVTVVNSVAKRVFTTGSPAAASPDTGDLSVDESTSYGGKIRLLANSDEDQTSWFLSYRMRIKKALIEASAMTMIAAMTNNRYEAGTSSSSAAI